MLEKYRQKRKFNLTPEPEGKEIKPSDHIFVVQKHDASHLHYDLRLQIGGVLKSWAIPKEPTLDPKVKRLAIQVEDHPLEYGNFEGIIPEGNYGAGNVIIWDKGTFSPAFESDNLKKTLEDMLKKGHLSIIFSGKKLNGEFGLVKINTPRYKNGWLLIKAEDKFADPSKKFDEKSIVSNKEISQIGNSENWLGKSLSLEIEKLPRIVLPKTVKPMMATLIDQPFDDEEWIFEIKWDGYRVLSRIENGNVELSSRNGNILNEKYPEIVNILKSIKANCILDGEIVAFNEEGKPDFQYLQDYQRTHKGRLVYYVFDILYLNDRNLENLPLIKRKNILKKLLADNDYIKESGYLNAKGKAFFEAAKDKGLEGIIAKHSLSIYEEGNRSKTWLKIKNIFEQEFIVGGFTKPKGGRQYIGSLILGVYENNKFRYIGAVGSGFRQEDLMQIHDLLKPIIVSKSPFSNLDYLPDVTWVKPNIVCEVKFQEFTKDGLLRQAVFLGLRDDKYPKEVVLEKTMPLARVK